MGRGPGAVAARGTMGVLKREAIGDGVLVFTGGRPMAPDAARGPVCALGGGDGRSWLPGPGKPRSEKNCEMLSREL